MKYRLLVYLLCFLTPLVNGQDSSVLNSGSWYKIAVTDAGIYKLDKAFLDNIGINTSGIDPKKIAIYGNGGGGMLPQENSKFRPNDLLENAIFVSGEEDGVFNNNDYVLFFGNSSDELKYSKTSGVFDYENNLYADSTTYFITIKEESGKRVGIKADEGNGFPIVNSYQSIITHEQDLINMIRAGRRWFGESFISGSDQLRLTFNGQDIVPNSNVKVISTFMAQAFGETSFDLTLNNQDLGSQIMDSVPEGTYSLKGVVASDTFNIDASTLGSLNDGLTIDIKFNPVSTGSSIGYLDYLMIQAERSLTFKNELLFHTGQMESSTTFQIENAPTSMMVWDISNPTAVMQQSYDLASSIAQFGITQPTTAYILFEGSDFPAPSFLGAVSNQNLHGLSGVDALFITHKNFLVEAERLANFRTQMDGLSIHVVTTEQVFNEFSSGMQDVSAIRDFAKFHYDTHGQKLKYLLLFGDASFDYKFREINKQNFVPVYEAKNSLDPIDSFSSDDYFGFMEDDEGEWVETRSGDHTLELGVGRLPVKTADEARLVVNKIIRYETSTNGFGSWRNDIVFIADDGDRNIHQRDANLLSTFVDTTRTEFNVQKIYLDAFEQVPSPNGEESPATSKAIQDAIEKGSLIVNYTGHGNELKLAHEDIINKTIIASLSNRIRLPFFVTATCDFGSYDNPLIVSGGESILLNPNGGAIGLLTTTRPVTSNTNYILNRAYYFAAMKKENGKYPRLGDIVRNTKNQSLSGPVNRNFTLLGDPTMRIAYPEYELELSTINGKALEEADTLRALGIINAGGRVIDQNGLTVTDFSGTVSVTVFDKETEFETKGNEQNAPAQIYNERKVLLFKGDASVEDGHFTIEFIIPKNISYVFGEGKISMYAVNQNKNQDAHGGTSDLIIGGSSTDIANDNTPPTITLFLNDSTFKSGQTVGPGPILLAKLSDTNGINISSAGFGQDISATIDEEDKVILNEYYAASENTFKEGWVVYDLDDLSPGQHTINLTVFDTHGNKTDTSIEFVISDNSDIELTEVKNFPNPLIESTTFSFSHDREGEELNVFLTIINLEGEIITQKSYRFDDSPSTINTIDWDGRDSSGNRIRQGIYIYKMIVQSTLDGAKNKAFGKLVVFN